MAFKNNTLSESTYTSYCESLKKAIFQANRSYYEQWFSWCSNDPKQTWKQINNVLQPTKPKNDIMLCYNNQAFSDSADIAECFNEFFCGNPRSLYERLQPVKDSHLQYVNRNENSFVFSPVTESDVVRTIFKIKSEKKTP